ncbi:MAG TPA: flagellar cap protein FliD N-terminal domain-containing protein, partial [bacterium]
MAEINPSARAAAPTGTTSSPTGNASLGIPAAQPKAKIPTNREINRISGLASGLDTGKTIEMLVAVERKRLEPTQQQKAQQQVELESFNLVRKQLGQIDAAVKSLAGKGVWEGKLVESSDEKTVTASATAGAKPGKYTLIVDKLALNHQLASQGYEKTDTPIGKGKFKITVGEGAPITLTIDDSNDSLMGLKDAIYFATKEFSDTIIK